MRQADDTQLEGPVLSAYLADHQSAVDAAIDEIEAGRVITRIWAGDHTVWKPDPLEIANRLGWLRSAAAMREQAPHITEFAAAVRAEGVTDVLLLGMGGSSLAPDVFAKVFAEPGSGLRLAVLDTTDPGAVLSLAERLGADRTLFIVSTKSGGTVETLSAFKFFYNWAAAQIGQGRAGTRFVAITDPGSGLASLAERYHFRKTFLNDPGIGGRYSALSQFGLVPAALVGVDLDLLLDRALGMAGLCGAGDGETNGANPGARLGAILGELAKAGRDKATFVVSPPIASFGDWLEQLIAESTGKEGCGIVPVVGEPLRPATFYGDDRVFVHLCLEGHDAYGAALSALRRAGFPVVRLRLRDRYDLGAQFFLWEMATAVAGQRLGNNPFDQPNVEAAKALARSMVTAYAESGALPTDEPAPLSSAALNAFLLQARPGDYVALQAYLQPTPAVDVPLWRLRSRIRDRFRLATTVGYGPRFLHSTGQLHKGDAGHGLFVQFTADDRRDADIPDEAGQPASSISFGTLKMAQALGDKQALLDAGRRVIRFHLGTDVTGNLEQLSDCVA